MYVNVLVEIGAKSVDREFVYFVPESLQNQIQIGIRVKVSFGKQTIEGFVISIFNDYHDDMSLKPIIEVIDPEPILNKEMIYLGKQIKETTLCSLISAYQAMLPKALKASINTNINIKEDKYPLGHGSKSVIFLQQFIKLTMEEIMAINWHMGFSVPKEDYGYLGDAFAKYPLAVALHEADLEATFLLEEA